MFLISLNLGSTTWQLLYKEKPSAQIETLRGFMRHQHLTQQLADQACITLSDDFGQEADINAGSLAGFLIEDTDLTQEAVIQRSLQQAQIQLKVNQRASRDPTLRSGLAQPGVPQFSPMVNVRN